MSERKLKLARTFSSRHELAAFLRELADRLEGADVDEFDVLDPDALAKFQVGVKNRQGEYVLKFRAKSSEPEALCPEGGTCVEVPQARAERAVPESEARLETGLAAGNSPAEKNGATQNDAGDGGEEPRPSYSKLKKRMKAQFRDITRSLQSGKQPASDVVDAFLADSALMITYHGKGDEYYPAYAAACQGFAQILVGGDLSLASERWDAIRFLMRDCHARYK